MMLIFFPINGFTNLDKAASIVIGNAYLRLRSFFWNSQGSPEFGTRMHSKSSDVSEGSLSLILYVNGQNELQMMS